MSQPTIKADAKTNSRLITDLDSLRYTYLEKNEDENISVFFPAAEIYTLEKHYFELLSNSRYVNFIPAWNYRPD